MVIVLVLVVVLLVVFFVCNLEDTAGKNLMQAAGSPNCPGKLVRQLAASFLKNLNLIVIEQTRDWKTSSFLPKIHYKLLFLTF